MSHIYEITTIADKVQDYEIIQVSPFGSGDSQGAGIRTLRKIGNSENNLAQYALNMYSLTGLDEVIFQDPLKILPKINSFTRPSNLRLIYDAFPVGFGNPILRICPANGEQILLYEYDSAKAKLPLEAMSLSDESFDFFFTGLTVLLYLKNHEEQIERYYCRDLRNDPGFI